MVVAPGLQTQRFAWEDLLGADSKLEGTRSTERRMLIATEAEAAPTFCRKHQELVLVTRFLSLKTNI